MKQYTITVNGNTYNVTVEEGFNSTPSVQATPAVKAAPVQTAPEAQALQTASAQGSIAIECPMSGKILSIKTKAGQSVKKGEPLMILEAMKMENDIVAPQDGVVASVNCSEGQAVESGMVLATLN